MLRLTLLTFARTHRFDCALLGFDFLFGLLNARSDLVDLRFNFRLAQTAGAFGRFALLRRFGFDRFSGRF
jgi:hypothetical protein